jgi:phage virion morphogenesis protein
MTDDAALFHQLDQVFADILSAMAPARRLRTARGIATALRRSQSQRIGKQTAPDGTKYPKRSRRVLTSRAGSALSGRGRAPSAQLAGNPWKSRAYADRI